MQNKLKKSGTIEKVFFQRIGFSAGLIRGSNNNKLEKFAGNLCAKKDRKVTLCGYYEESKYGKQFFVQYVKPEISMDLTGLAKYIAIRPDVKGVGPSKSKKIVKNFGFNFEKILLSNPEKITFYANLKKDSLKELQTSWKQTKGWNEVYAWLASFGFSYFQIEKLAKSFGSECFFLMKQDPYSIIQEIKGIGFVKMDEIALKLGFDKKFSGRLLGALKYATYTQLKNGHCWIEANELRETAIKFLALDDPEAKSIIQNVILESISNGTFSSYPLKKDNSMAVGLSKIAEYEYSLAQSFSNQGSSPHAHLFKRVLSSSINNLEELTLNKMQTKAVVSALESNISIISGGAGTGKTYTIKAIAKMYQLKNLSVAIAAPTGKAARRIEEITGIKGSTLHRLMGYNGGIFKYEKNNLKIETDALIVDEVSMIDVELFWHLLQYVNLIKTTLILVGDHNQLPPIGPGNVLRDLMAAKPVAITILNEVMRQAGILKENSSAILKAQVKKISNTSQQAWYVEDHYNDPLKLKNRVLEMFDNHFEDLGFDILYDVQILSPTHKGPIGASQLNLDIRRIVQKKLFNVNIEEIVLAELNYIPKLNFYKHDKVIQTVNDYDNHVMNGEIGFITRIDKLGNITVKFSGNKKSVQFKNNSKAISNIQLAYCLSIHKVQGSQFPCVALIIYKSHSFMHHRNLLYTAVTRAEETVIIVGDKWGIQNCANKVETARRRTFLSFYMPPTTKM